MARTKKNSDAPAKTPKETLEEKVKAAKLELDEAEKPYTQQKEEIEKLEKELSEKRESFKELEKAYTKKKSAYDKHKEKLDAINARELLEKLSKSGKSFEDILSMLNTEVQI